MTLCPIAILAGCKKCIFLKICFLKGLIGDYKEEEDKNDKKKPE